MLEQPGAFDDALSPDDEGWQHLSTWISQATVTVEVMPPMPQSGPDALRYLNTGPYALTTASPVGAMAWHTSGILVDHRWLRLLGGTSTQGLDNLAAPSVSSDLLGGALLLAHDVLGGLFALNDGSLPGAAGEVSYFAPDLLAWEPLGLTDSTFYRWALTGDLDAFYAGLRWPDWQQESFTVCGGWGIAVTPPLHIEQTAADVAGGMTYEVVAWEQVLGAQCEAVAQAAGVPATAQL